MGCHILCVLIGVEDVMLIMSLSDSSYAKCSMLNRWVLGVYGFK